MVKYIRKMNAFTKFFHKGGSKIMKRIGKVLFAILFMVLAFAIVGCKNDNGGNTPGGDDTKNPNIAFASSS